MHVGRNMEAGSVYVGFSQRVESGQSLQLAPAMARTLAETILAATEQLMPDWRGRA